jgi:hypothetical protein
LTPLVALFRSPNRGRASVIAGFAASTIAIVALIGLWADLPMLSIWGSALPAEKPLAAFGLAAFGLALIHPGTDSRFSFAAGLAMATIAVLNLAAVAFEVPRAASFAAASEALVTFGLAGSSLALSRFERYRIAATLLAGLAGAIAGFAMLGDLTGITAGHPWPALRRRRDHLTGRHGALAAQVAAVVAAGHVWMRDCCAAPPVRC